MYVMFHSKMQTVKVAVKLRSRQKGGFWTPISRGVVPQISGIHFEIALTSERAASFD